MSRWSTLLLDEAELADMPHVPESAIVPHAEALIRTRPTYRALYRSWERQQWSAEALSFERDARHWTRLPDPVRNRLERLVNNFLVGEYTGLDLLGPILAGAPDEDALVYLGTQVADESRHTRLMARLATEVLGVTEDDLAKALPMAWSIATPAQRALSALETRVIGPLTPTGTSYEEWLRAVAVFHVVSEGVLALNGQRQVVAALRTGSFLPGLRTGFVAMTRDESRHVSFGMEAVRRGVLDGHEEAVADVLHEALPLAIAIELPDRPTPAERAAARHVAEELRTEALRRIRQLGLSRSTADWIADAMAAVNFNTDPQGEDQ